MGSTVDIEVVLDPGKAGSNPARFNFLIHFFLLCFKFEGWWLFNKKFQNISFPQHFFCFFMFHIVLSRWLNW